jgi:hypothetical protein
VHLIADATGLEDDEVGMLFEHRAMETGEHREFTSYIVGQM